MHALLIATLLVPTQAKPLSAPEMTKLLQTLDSRMRSPGDYQAIVYIEEKAPKAESKVSQVVVYRRDADDNLIILFTKPKTRAGQGFMRLEKNLWSYDPATGKWDRRTEQDRIAGNSRRRDFDDWRLSEE